MKQEDTSGFLEKLANAVITMNEEEAVRLAGEAIEKGVDPYLVIDKGLARGMEIMGEEYENGSCFIPELLLASDTMYAGINVLSPYIKAGRENSESRVYRAIMGVIEGDTHDIGKNIVKVMFEARGFQITDLGRDVPIHRFVEAAATEQADIICMSSLISTTMLGMGDVIDLLVKEGIREKFKVMVGGACVSQSFASRIGADGYAPDAIAAVRKARKLLKIQ